MSCDTVDANGVPNHILNYPITSTVKIYISFIIPLTLQLLVYLMQIACDIGVTVQYFRTGQYHFGLVTILFITSPPFIAFWLLILAPSQCPKSSQQSKASFICNKFLHLMTFPVSMVYRWVFVCVSFPFLMGFCAVMPTESSGQSRLCFKRKRMKE